MTPDDINELQTKGLWPLEDEFIAKGYHSKSEMRRMEGQKPAYDELKLENERLGVRVVMITESLIEIREERNKAIKLLAHLEQALEACYKQRYGMDHTWAGMFKKCDKQDACKTSMNPAGLYAFGGNWNSREDMCPQCQAKQSLEKVKEFKADE